MLSTERDAPVSFPQLSMKCGDFTRSPNHEIGTPCKGIQLPGVEMQRRELAFGRGTDLFDVLNDSGFGAFGSQAIQVGSHQSASPGGNAGDFIRGRTVATGRDGTY